MDLTRLGWVHYRPLAADPLLPRFKEERAMQIQPIRFLRIVFSFAVFSLLLLGGCRRAAGGVRPTIRRSNRPACG